MRVPRAASILAIASCTALVFPAPAAPRDTSSIRAAAAATTDADGPGTGCTAADDGVQCLAQEFVRADSRINDSYQRLLAAAPVSSRGDIVAQQRAWLVRRDTTCHLDARRARSSSWIPYVLEDRTRAICVLRLANERTAELDALAGVYAKLAQGGPAGVQFEVRPQHSDAEYVAVSPVGHEKGRWYFEVAIDLSKVRSPIEATLQIGIGRADGQSTTGTAFHIRPMDLIVKPASGGSVTIVNGNMGRDAHLSTAFVGIAADLDAGRVYVRRAARWIDGNPGSSGGSELLLGREYRAVVYSSVLLRDLVQQGIVSINFGSKPFADAVPDGYQPFVPRPDGMIGDSNGASPFLPASSMVAGKSTAFWIRQYWEWARGFPAAQRPSADTTGERCAAGQKGPVWFLTGTESSGAVQRLCDVPANTVMMVPIVNTMTWSSQGPEPCALLQARLVEGTSTVTDLRLSVDGVSLKSPASYHAATGCFELRDVPRGVTGAVATDGFWVFIHPLPPGKHDIRFGGRFAIDSFKQDIHYIINVR